MATVWAIASGYVSDGTIWNTGVIPGIDDLVYADGKNLIIDMDWQVSGLRTTARSGGTAGGSFTIKGSYSVSAIQGYIGGSSTSAIQIHSNFPNTVIIEGEISQNTVSGKTLEIIGDADVYIIGNSGNNSGVYGCYATYYNSTGGTLHISGNIVGGSNNWGIGHTGNPTGLFVKGSGNVIHVGNCTSNGAHAVHIAGTGYFKSNGTAISSSTNTAIYSTGTANVFFNGFADMQVPPAVTIPAIYAASSGTGVVYVGGILSNRDSTPSVYALRIGLLSTSTVQWTYITDNGTSRNIYTADVSPLGNPSISDVRKDIAFGPVGELIGTLAVPPPESVIVGVPTDNTVGNCEAMNAADFLAELANSNDPLAVRLRNVATTEIVGEQFEAFKNQ